MIRRVVGVAIVRLAKLEEGFADIIEATAPRVMDPGDDRREQELQRAARLRTSALHLRQAAIGVMIGPSARW